MTEITQAQMDELAAVIELRDKRIAELEHQLEIRKAAIEAQFRLINRAKELEKALQDAKIPHLVVDGDCWYSCPKSGKCCNESEDKSHCNCGADKHNAAIDAALNSRTGVV